MMEYVAIALQYVEFDSLLVVYSRFVAFKCVT